MSADWYDTLMSRRHGAVNKKIDEFNRLVADGKQKRSWESDWMRSNLTPIFEQHAQAQQWHDFFDEVSLFAAFFEATNGPKQDVREAYFARVCPEPKRSYQIPPEGSALLQDLSLEPTFEDLRRALSGLPTYSWFLWFRFRLTAPYLSKDDAPFYVIDNPVRKDKVLKLPFVAPSSWKGSTRAALRRKRRIDGSADERTDSLVVRLFGNVKGEEEEERFRAGRLHFFPTFFTQVGQEVINPHDREGGAGEQPIYIETVPAGATGIFVLLYVPFDLVETQEEAARLEVFADLKAVTEAVEAMFTVYGFGAKTSSGFGMADDTFPKLQGEEDGGAVIVNSIGPYPLEGFKKLENAVMALGQKMVPEGEA